MIFGPLYTNTKVHRVWDGAAVSPVQNKSDLFFTFIIPTGAPAQVVTVLQYNDDPAAPAGTCRPLLPGTPVQYKEPNCLGFSVNAAGNLILKFSAPGVAPAADEIGVPALAAGEHAAINVRIPQCPGRAWLGVQGVTATVQVLGIHPSSAR